MQLQLAKNQAVVRYARPLLRSACIDHHSDTVLFLRPCLLFFFFFLISFLVSSRFFLRLSRIVIDARTLPHERLERDSHFWITRDSPRRTYGFPPDFLERNKNGRRSDFRVVARRNRSASNRAFRYHFILASISSRVINTRIRGRISDLARRTCT